MSGTAPILEFDPDTTAILEPSSPAEKDSIPDRCVLCFFNDVLENLFKQNKLTKVSHLKSEIGINPIYELNQTGVRLMVVHPGVGAPLAAGFLEEIIAMGVRKFLVTGGCGVLNREITAGHPVVITSAVRDEGTSYHYLPPDREVIANPHAVAVIEAELRRRGLDYRLGKTWTTDAIYRETRQKRDLRVAEGCSIVEMEAAALFAVAQFRGVTLGQVVYGGDLVVPEGWDGRAWYRRADDRELMFWLAAEACTKL